MRARLPFLALLLSGLAFQAQAAMSMRNISISPEFVCPGQAVTLKWQEMYSFNNGNQTWGVFSTNNALWDNPNDYEYMASGHTSGSTAASTPGTPAGTTLALSGGAPDGFWHDYSFVTTIPGSITGTNITFFINGLDAGPNFASSTTYEAQLSITAQLSCTQKAIYNKATLWEQEATARLVIQNSCGTPSNTPTRSATRTATRTATATATPTDSPTRTATRTQTATATPTATPSVSPSQSATRTQTTSNTPTATPSVSPTQSATRTQTATFTPTFTVSASPSPSFTASPPFSSTNTPTRTESWTPSSTPSQTPTRSSTPTPSATPTASPSFTESFTLTQTVSQTDTPTISPTPSQTPIFSATDTPTWTATPSVTPSFTQTITFTDSPTRTATLTASPSATPTVTFSDTRTPTPSRTVTLTVTDSPTRTVSPTITQTLVPVPYQVSVTVYNSAGERVKLLFDGAASVLPRDVLLDSTVLRSGVDTLTLDLIGQLSTGGHVLLWTGSNDSGQRVEGGVYYFKVEYRDQFGMATSYTKSVQVLEAETGSHIDVFNSAGELVYRADFSNLSSTVTGFDLDDAIGLSGHDDSGNAPDVISGTLRFADGSRLPFSWDAMGMDGRPLNTGIYTAVLTTENQGSATRVDAKSLSVIRLPDSGLSWEPQVGPSPARIDGAPGVGRRFKVFYPALELFEVSANLYNLAGERVSSTSAPNGSGCAWLSYEGVASGIYIVELRGRLQSGGWYRKTIKVAIVQ